MVEYMLKRLSNGTGDLSFQASSLPAASSYSSSSCFCSVVSLFISMSNSSTTRSFFLGKTSSNSCSFFDNESLISICLGDYSRLTSETLPLRNSKVFSFGQSSVLNNIFSMKANIFYSMIVLAFLMVDSRLEVSTDCLSFIWSRAAFFF